MIRSITFILAAVILLSSCGNKFSLQKRKYTKGYYFSGTKNRSTTNHHNETVAKNTARPKADTQLAPAENEVDSGVNTTEDVPMLEKQVVSFAPNEANTVKQNSPKITASASNNVVTGVAGAKVANLKPIKLPANSSTHRSALSDGMLIVLVILCFFWWLNLISVFIHDSQSITLNFWITLLLDILYLPGLIFSILVVLDVVNLA